VEHLTHYFQIILLGLIEGVTEFLPISSQAHLLLARSLGLDHEPEIFHVLLQTGAILAAALIFWPKIGSLLSHLENRAAREYLLKIFAAFVITSALSLLVFRHEHWNMPETLVPVAWAMLIGGVVIFAVEFLAKNLYSHDDVSWLEATLIGAAQVLGALFPGASRFGATMMTGLALGMTRSATTEFAFLLGIPTLIAANAFDFARYRGQFTGSDHQLMIDSAIGFVVSFIVTFFVVNWLLRFVKSHTFNGFAIYRVLLGAGILIALSIHALPKEKSEEKAGTSPAMETNAPAATAPTNTDLITNAPAATNLDAGTNASPLTNGDAVGPATNSLPENVPTP
jgi:undecaprenyl-diphosphatase